MANIENRKKHTAKKGREGTDQGEETKEGKEENVQEQRDKEAQKVLKQNNKEVEAVQEYVNKEVQTVQEYVNKEVQTVQEYVNKEVQTVQEKEDKGVQTENIQSSMSAWPPALLFLLVSSVFASYHFSEQNWSDSRITTVQHGQTGQMLSDAQIKEIKSAFPAQSRRFWASVISVSNAVLQGDPPKAPAVTMMVVGKEALPTAKCIIHKLASVIEGRDREAFIVKHNSDDQRDPDDIRYDIGTQLETAIQDNGHNVIVVYDLDQLPTRAVMLFHGYCDNVNANYKHVHYYFTITMDTDNIKDESLADIAAKEYLSEVWGPHLDRDLFAPLWSRIGNNVIVVRAENGEFPNNC